MNSIQKMIRNTHRVHATYADFWDFLLQSYEGGIDYTNASLMSTKSNAGLFDKLQRYFVNGVQQPAIQTIKGNLFMHPKEKTEDYARRVQMSYYYNFCAPIIDIYSDHLFKQAVTEDLKELQDTLEKPGVADNIDLKGSTIQEFREKLSKKSQLYGHCFVLIDSPSISKTGEVVTMADQIEKRAFPYLAIFNPQNVLNWSLDENGFARWVLLREVYDGNEDPFDFDEKNSVECTYRLWTKTEWVSYDVDGEETGRGAHNLGVVPLVCVFDKQSEKVRNFLGISTIGDIAFIARDVYNASSELRQILRDQTFAFLAIQGTSDEYSGIDLGTGKGLIYPPERNAPQYVSPPADNANVYFDHIDRQISKIFDIAKIGSAGYGGRVKATPDAGPSVDSQSGVSKAWDFNQVNSALSAKAKNLQDGEMRIWQIFALWMGIKLTGTITYPTEFSVSSLQDDMKEAEQAARVQLGRTFDSEIRKTIIKKKFPNKEEKDLEAMFKEVDALMLKNEQPASPIADRLRGLFQQRQPGGQSGSQ